jgi:FtsZ-binding cell division protein ZapB
VGFVLEILEFLEKLDNLESDYLPADSGQRIKKKVNNLKSKKTKWQEQILTSCCRQAVTSAT